MEKNKRRSIAIFWDYENARPVAETSIVGLSGRIRDLLIPHGDIVSRKVCILPFVVKVRRNVCRPVFLRDASC